MDRVGEQSATIEESIFCRHGSKNFVIVMPDVHSALFGMQRIAGHSAVRIPGRFPEIYRGSLKLTVTCV